MSEQPTSVDSGDVPAVVVAVNNNNTNPWKKDKQEQVATKTAAMETIVSSIEDYDVYDGRNNHDVLATIHDIGNCNINNNNNNETMQSLKSHELQDTTNVAYENDTTIPRHGQDYCLPDLSNYDDTIKNNNSSLLEEHEIENMDDGGNLKNLSNLNNLNISNFVENNNKNDNYDNHTLNKDKNVMDVQVQDEEQIDDGDEDELIYLERTHSYKFDSNDSWDLHDDDDDNNNNYVYNKNESVGDVQQTLGKQQEGEEEDSITSTGQSPSPHLPHSSSTSNIHRSNGGDYLGGRGSKSMYSKREQGGGNHSKSSATTAATITAAAEEQTHHPDPPPSKPTSSCSVIINWLYSFLSSCFTICCLPTELPSHTHHHHGHDYSNRNSANINNGNRRVNFHPSTVIEGLESSTSTARGGGSGIGIGSGSGNNGTRKKSAPHKLLIKYRPSATRISSFIVRHAPCFWCYFLHHHRLDPTISATDRAILFRLNILNAFAASIQVIFAIIAAIILLLLTDPGNNSDGSVFLTHHHHYDNHHAKAIQSNNTNAGSGTTIIHDDDINGGAGSSSSGSIYPSNSQTLERNTYLSPNLWNPIGSIFLLGFVGFFLCITCIVTLRVVRHVNLIGALRYYWILLWVLPIEIFLSISLFDYHRVTDVWVKHWWRTPAFAWLRYKFCADETSESKCIAPEEACVPYSVSGGNLFTVEDWCLTNFNATDCADIRFSAQVEMRKSAYVFFYFSAIWGLLLVCLLFLTVHALEAIITIPIIRSSKERSISAWLLLPIIGCAWTGSTLLFSPSSVIIEFGSSVFWIGVTYVASAGTFFFAALLGLYISFTSVLSPRGKRRKEFAVVLFIVTMILTIVSVAAIFASSLIYSVSLVDAPVNYYSRGNIACEVDQADSCKVESCYNPVSASGMCNSTFFVGGCGNSANPRCPSWCDTDVLKVLQTQLKQSATLAAIFLLYAFGALRFGFVLKKHVSMYQIDYV